MTSVSDTPATGDRQANDEPLPPFLDQWLTTYLREAHRSGALKQPQFLADAAQHLDQLQRRALQELERRAKEWENGSPGVRVPVQGSGSSAPYWLSTEPKASPARSPKPPQQLRSPAHREQAKQIADLLRENKRWADIERITGIPERTGRYRLNQFPELDPRRA